MSKREDLSEEIARLIENTLGLASSVLVKAWSDDSIATLVDKKINTLSLCVLMSLPKLKRVESSTGSDFRLIWEIALEQNPVTSKGKGLPRACDVAESLMRALDGITLEGASKLEYYNIRVEELNPGRNGSNHVHNLIISCNYPFLDL